MKRGLQDDITQGRISSIFQQNFSNRSEAIEGREMKSSCLLVLFKIDKIPDYLFLKIR